jgi:biotin carboxyl carrier protein
MRYIVTVGEREMEVDVDGERVTVGGRPHSASLAVIPGTLLRQLVVDGRPLALAVTELGRGRWGLTVQGERWEAEALDERARHIRSLTNGADRPKGPGALRAPMPGLVVRVEVEPGQSVTPGVGMVVLEAMKMENELKAAGSGVVRSVLVGPGEAVEKGQVLVEFEPAGA